MFNFPGDKAITSNRERINNQILGSYKGTEAVLVKGLSMDEFNSQYPKDKFEVYSFESLQNAKNDLKKGEDFNEVKFDSEVSKMKPIVVQNDEGKKKLMYVKEKAV